MCGILAVLGLSRKHDDRLRRTILEKVRLLRHRGPDESGISVSAHAILAHERLALSVPVNGKQPLVGNGCSVVVNGEIYNHHSLRSGFNSWNFTSTCDCEVLLPLFVADNTLKWINALDGQFAFVACDSETGAYAVARDPIGICSLYFGHGVDGEIWVASEMKAILGTCNDVAQFPPGCYLTSQSSEPIPYYTPIWMKVVPSRPAKLSDVRNALVDAVGKRIDRTTPWGVLLSGGLDSSLIASIASRTGPVATFSVGLRGSPDLLAARKVADYIGSTHHELLFTEQEGLDAVRDVVWHLETYDVTTIRAAVPMYLLARYVKSTGRKMVLSGEGADEALAGYLYFHKAPSAMDLHHETVRKLADLHNFDCLRANKSCLAWGVEVRVPFLDRDFLDLVMGMDPTRKMCGGKAQDIEKLILREAFAGKGFLPDEVLWRQKEQFSDGVGYGWIDALKAHATNCVSDSSLAAAAFRYPRNTPRTAEAYHLRRIFATLFPHGSASLTVPASGGKSGGCSVACSTGTAIAWDAAFRVLASRQGGDCSGRAVADVHVIPKKNAVSSWLRLSRRLVCRSLHVFMGDALKAHKTLNADKNNLRIKLLMLGQKIAAEKPMCI